MQFKKYGLYIHGQYVHTEQYQTSSCPFKRQNVAYPNDLGQISYLKEGDALSEELFESILVGSHETYEQVLKGFFPLPERVAFLRRLYERLSDQAWGMADLISREVSKPITLAKAEVERSLLTLKYTIEECEAVLAEESLSFNQEKIWAHFKIKVRRQARGPLLAITPFNFPLNLIIHKLAPAIAAGCPVLLKPSPKALMTALSVVDMCHASDLPAGMLCFVPCDNDTTLKFAKAEKVPVISFTGSSTVGWFLKKELSNKAVFLELGGTAPAYVDESCTQLEAIAKALTLSAFSFSGQSCISCQNLFVHEKIYNDFREKIKLAAKDIVFSDPYNEKSQASAVIDLAARNKIEATMHFALQNGATVLSEVEGQYVSDSKLSESSVILPRIFESVPEDCSLYSEEVFGPTLNLCKISSFEAFLNKANNYTHRLQASVFSQDEKMLHAAQDRLHFGGVICNYPPNTRIDAAPYGGEGLSGVGREGPRWAMEDFTSIKTIIY